jgi:hypothetical protein
LKAAAAAGTPTPKPEGRFVIHVDDFHLFLRREHVDSFIQRITAKFGDCIIAPPDTAF